MEIVMESEVEELELEDVESEEDTVSARQQFVEKLQKAFDDWDSKQKEAGKRRTPHHYFKNSKKTLQRRKRAAMENKKGYKEDIVSLLLKAGVCFII